VLDIVTTIVGPSTAYQHHDDGLFFPEALSYVFVGSGGRYASGEEDDRGPSEASDDDEEDVSITEE
jgi:hypothetical protein